MLNATNRSKSQYETLYILGYTKMTKSDICSLQYKIVYIKKIDRFAFNIGYLENYVSKFFKT
jgi:hypothetical protein